MIYPFSEKAFPLQENEFVGIHPNQLNKLLTSPWYRRKEKLVLLQPATFSSKLEFNAHRLLRSMDLNTLLSKLPLSEQADLTDQFYSYADLIARCESHSYLLVNAQKLLEQCQFSFYFQAVKKTVGTSWAQTGRTLIFSGRKLSREPSVATPPI